MDERDERDVYRAKEAMQSAMKKGPMRLAVIIGAILVGFLILHPWVQIGAGERGVVLNFGAVQDKVLNEGLHFRMPIQQRVAIMDVKVQKAVTDATSASADLQDVTSSVALNYHVIPNNIAVDAVSIVAFSFSKIFTDAIESKQTAEQLALKARRDLDRIKIEAEQKITAAQAEAESLRLQRANISTDLIELRKIEANLKAIEKWNGILPQVTGGGAVPFIGVGEIQKR